MTTSKDWEEYKKSITSVLDRQMDYGTISDPLLREIFKEADSQIEKTRRECLVQRTERVVELNNEHIRGFKAGLQRAIEVTQESLKFMSCSCSRCVVENLKKEMEK